MKIITTTYFRDFARYFDCLEHGIAKKFGHDVQFFNVAIYPAAYHYFKSKGKHCIYSQNCTPSNINYDHLIHAYGNDLDDLISFNSKSFKLYGKDNDDRLKQQALKYLAFFEPLFIKKSFDFLISSGDTRLLPCVVIHLAKKHGVKVVYFEQGPFDTTMLDPRGVNCNISFIPSFKKLTAIEKFKLEQYRNDYKNNKVEKYWQSDERNLNIKFNTYLTFLLMYPPRLFSKILPVDLQIGLDFKTALKEKVRGQINKYFKKQHKFVKNEVNLKDDYIVLFLQVPVDAQFIDNSPNFNSFTDIVRLMAKSIPVGKKLLIREHPFYIGRYDTELYNIVHSNVNIHFANECDLTELIVNSDLCIVNNSTVGIEALLLQKKVFTLGTSYYTHKGVTFDYDKTLGIDVQMTKALMSEFASVNVDSFLYTFIFDYLCEGHFQDRNLQFPSKLLNLLTRDV
jgi:capsular polysaccharide export protein